MTKCKGKGKGKGKGGRRLARAVMALALVMALIPLAGCGIKLTVGQNMGFQALTINDTFKAVEAAATAAYAKTEDKDRRIWIYHNVYPALDRAAQAIETYIQAAQEALRIERAGGKPQTDPGYLLKEAEALVKLAKEMWEEGPKK